MAIPTEDARYVVVPIASGLGSTPNTCGGCGGTLDVSGDAHHVFDCLVVFKTEFLNLQRTMFPNSSPRWHDGNCGWYPGYVGDYNCGCVRP